jgi:hypothetical protein
LIQEKIIILENDNSNLKFLSETINDKYKILLNTFDKLEIEKNNLYETNENLKIIVLTLKEEKIKLNSPKP